MTFPRWAFALSVIAVSGPAAIAGTPNGSLSLRAPLLHAQNPIRLPSGLVVACLWDETDSLVLASLNPANRPGALPLSLAGCPNPIEKGTTGDAHATMAPILVGSERDLEPSPLDKLVAPPGMGGEPSSSRANDDELELRKTLTLLAPTLLYSNPSGRAELDRIITEFREQRDRTSSGLWKLRLVYHGTTQIISEVAPPYDGILAANREMVELWIREHPSSPAPYVFLAAMLRNHALATLRNPLEATKRTPWNDGSAPLAALRAFLLEHKQVASSDPHWYALMIEVMGLQGEGRDAILLMLDEAVRREPLYYETYFAAARAIIGSSDQPVADLENLARYAVRMTERSEGTSLYARLYWIALREMGDPEFFSAMTQHWPQMRESILDVLARYPDQWNIQNFAYFACLAQDKPTSRSLMSKVSGRRFSQAWGQLEVHQACQDWAASEDTPSPPPTRARAVVP